MKRNLDLIRDIMLFIENSDDITIRIPTGSNIIKDSSGQDYNEQTVFRHIELLADAELIKANITEINTDIVIIATITGITWQGYEFLETIREQDIFDKIKSQLSKISSFALPIVQQLGVELLKTKWGLK